MVESKGRSVPAANRGEAVRQRVIDAAERLLRHGKAEYSMRDLAAEAGVSFATPFNQFGSKAAIMHALAERRIGMMTDRYVKQPPLPNAAERVLLAVSIAAAGMLEEPVVNRAVMGWIGTAGPVPGRALTLSASLWRLALGDGNGLDEVRRKEALAILPRQLAFGFRGVLSFWTAGELANDELASSAERVATTLLLGFSKPG
ncbi:TetR/AcrR family transcriptional regulator [Sphingomonas desiccabilis]|uniref:TetR/AcrR family transcriptional regulator n=1 Tax=Sphingomonas desiccabilis TaxID=429134 RepID=A0A4Q2J1R0_9SPHN|nr:TetR/AcrR family transcriptional regulator [Sphingomonas desiccabilis]MBB3910923.1 AcrR family transcriptional regulator [Sphingomonas desiccabilis]RXZ35514.1 TetR/AcrR family transcriptional regulator [Sphingomonas desiccabilis]